MTVNSCSWSRVIDIAQGLCDNNGGTWEALTDEDRDMYLNDARYVLRLLQRQKRRIADEVDKRAYRRNHVKAGKVSPTGSFIRRMQP